MNVRTLKTPPPRIDTKYIATLGIKAYDSDNLYPQKMLDIVSASPTGRGCLNRYANFIEGNGLTDVIFAEFVINRGRSTVDDIHHLLSCDIATYKGFALHVNYNIFGKITEINHIPFEHCRLEEEDDLGEITHVFTHPDWKGKRTRSGKTLKVNADTIDKFPVFNPDPVVVQAQIQQAGGIEYYNGQVLWVSADGKNTYPKAKYDSVASDMVTDEGISNLMNRNVKNNFYPAGMLVTKKSQSQSQDDDEGGNNSDYDSGFIDDVVKLQGDMNAGKLLGVTLENDEEMPQFIPFPINNLDKEFTVTSNSVTERIYATFDQEPFYCIRIGKTGFSGDIVSDAYCYYAGQVTNEQRMLSRAYKQIFNNWFEPISVNNFSIEPLKYLSNGTTSN